MTPESIHNLTEFYDHAFNHLLSYLTNFLAFIGIITGILVIFVPIALARRNLRDIKEEQKKLEKLIEEKINETKQDIIDNSNVLISIYNNELKNNIEDFVNKEIIEIHKNFSVQMGILNHLLGALHAEKKTFSSSIISYTAAIQSFVESNKVDDRVEICCTEIIEVLGLVNYSELTFEDTTQIQQAYNRFIPFINNKNSTGRFNKLQMHIENSMAKISSLKKL